MEEIKDNEENRTKVITVKVTPSELKKIDKYAKKIKINRSQMIRNFVESGMDDLDLMNRTGLLTMALKGVDLLSNIKSSLDSDKYHVENGKIIIEL
jgi:metal-responsive CopG/Arc/MetJ family transcriptional regulator